MDQTGCHIAQCKENSEQLKRYGQQVLLNFTPTDMIVQKSVLGVINVLLTFLYMVDLVCANKTSMNMQRIIKRPMK